MQRAGATASASSVAHRRAAATPSPVRVTMFAHSNQPTSRTFGHAPAFEWRVNAGRWRWLILSALGAAPIACGGRADAPHSDANGGNLEGQGGTQGSPPIYLGYGGSLDPTRSLSSEGCANPVSL